MLKIGSLVDGKYKILNKIGQGGMSVVYLAMNEKANKQWAIKEVRKDGVMNFEAVRQGLVAETDILKKLSHPNLPSIIDVIDTDDSFIIIMDYIEGNSLNDALNEYGAQPQEYVIEWAKQLCDVLGYLHSRVPPIIYRDMKPANVMLKPDGNVMLIDFGTAREYKEKNLADTTCLGTVGYAAPEQFGGMGQTDARTDIYCLGATLYHLVTGMNPCEPPYEIKPIRSINPSLSSGFEKIIIKCTQADPNNRYQSAAELMYALEHYEEIDDEYRKKQKRKLSAFITASALAVVFAATSLWSYNSAISAKNANYDNIIKTAIDEQKNATTQDEYDRIINGYKNAIMINPSRADAYLGLIEFMRRRNVKMNSKEAKIFGELKNKLSENTDNGTTAIIDNPLEQLKNADYEKYQEVCFNIGELYVYKYEAKKRDDRYAYAEEWYSEARNKYTKADLYCKLIGSLTAAKQNKEARDTVMEAENVAKIWQAIKELYSETKDIDKDLKVISYYDITCTLNDYIKELYFVAEDKSEINQMLDEIESYIASLDSPFLQDEINNIEGNIKESRERIKSIMKGATSNNDV